MPIEPLSARFPVCLLWVLGAIAMAGICAGEFGAAFKPSSLLKAIGWRFVAFGWYATPVHLNVRATGYNPFFVWTERSWLPN